MLYCFNEFNPYSNHQQKALLALEPALSLLLVDQAGNRIPAEASLLLLAIEP
jgi:hypothetical protein